MIKNGNYEYFDFEAHKDKFKEVFVKVYGEKFRDVISNRLDTVQYIPYIEPTVVYEYYNQILNNHKDEIFGAFKKFMGLKTISKEMADLLWSETTLESPLVRCISEGENLADYPNYASDEKDKKEMLKNRNKAYKLFGLTGKNKLEKLQNIVRLLDKSMTLVGERHKCDVVRDIKRYQENKATSLQMYLTKLSKNGFPFTDKDREILAKPDIDFVDVHNLDCNRVLFDRNVGNPGLIYFFRSEANEVLQKGENVPQIEQILQYRMMYYLLNEPEIEKEFEYVTKDEVLGKVQPIERIEYLNRLGRELSIIQQKYPDYTISPELADSVEQYRQVYADGIYSGCKFAKNINKDYQRTVHDPFESEWVTYLEHDKDMMGAPVNYIFFNESGNKTPESLLGNLLHELNHVIRRSDSYLDKSGTMAITRIGIHTTARYNMGDGTVSDTVVWDPDIMQVEENINERISRVLKKVFMNKYGCVYGDSDIKYRNQEEMTCLYDEWDFITEFFYKHFKKSIYEHPLNSDFDMYFRYQNPPVTSKEAIVNSIKEKYRRTVTPNAFSETGKVDSKKVSQLGELVKVFREDVLPVFYDYGVSFEDFKTRSGNYATLPLQTRDLIDEIENETRNVCRSMIADERAVANYQRNIQEGKIGSGAMSVLTSDVKDKASAIMDLFDRAKKNTRDLVSAIVGSGERKGKKSGKKTKTEMATEEEREEIA